jgi:dTDP-4-dehydrorhamnose reductase
MTKERSRPRILLTGKTGQVGTELAPFLQRMGELTVLDRRQLDLAKPDEIRRVIRALRPDLIVNAAAYTAVDRAESDQAAARAINAVAPGVMAEEARKLGALFVHYSTDYVFDGASRTPYQEDAPVNPLNVYGRTKLEGERAILQAGAAYLIFRTGWVYALQGRNFLLTVLRLATEKEELRIVRDQTGAPTSSREIAAATVKILSQLYSVANGALSPTTSEGIYHMTAGGETNWYSFAKLILELASGPPGPGGWLAGATNNRSLIARRIVPIATHEFPTPARRPAYSVLGNRKLNDTFGVKLPDWETQLRTLLSDNIYDVRMPETNDQQRPAK